MEYLSGLCMELAHVMAMQISVSHCQEKWRNLARYASNNHIVLLLTVAIKVYAGCDCQHRTAGNNCEMCQPLYNNAEYMRGTIDNASVCQST